MTKSKNCPQNPEVPHNSVDSGLEGSVADAFANSPDRNAVRPNRRAHEALSGSA